MKLRVVLAIQLILVWSPITYAQTPQDFSSLDPAGVYESMRLFDYGLELLRSGIDDPQPETPGIKCARGYTAVKIAGDWYCISDLAPDETYRDRDSFKFCSDTDRFGRLCLKVRIKCKDGICKLEIIPPLLVLPTIRCEIKPDDVDPSKTVIECEEIDPITIPNPFGDPIEIFPGLPHLVIPYKITPDKKFCFTDPETQRGVCLDYPDIPGIKDIVPKLPGFPTEETPHHPRGPIEQTIEEDDQNPVQR